MKKLFMLLLLFGSTNFLKADEDISSVQLKDSYCYFVIGCFTYPSLFPVIGFGSRAQCGHNGLDVGIQGMGTPSCFLIKSNLTYLYYPKPKLQNQIYFGLGVGLEDGRVENTSKGNVKIDLISPELVFGNQHITNSGGRRFLEVQVSPCFFTPNASVAVMPTVIFRYGIGF